MATTTCGKIALHLPTERAPTVVQKLHADPHPGNQYFTSWTSQTVSTG